MDDESIRQLQRMIATAVLDDAFRQRLLNGDRPHIVAEFGLPEQDAQTVLSIQADNLEAFAAALLERMDQLDETYPGP